MSKKVIYDDEYVEDGHRLLSKGYEKPCDVRMIHGKMYYVAGIQKTYGEFWFQKDPCIVTWLPVEQEHLGGINE